MEGHIKTKDLEGLNMERERAENYREILLCPLCDFISLGGSRTEIINHLVKDHSDKEGIEELEWK